MNNLSYIRDKCFICIIYLILLPILTEMTELQKDELIFFQKRTGM